MKYIDDLSFSGLVSLIDGSEIKGADVLNNIAHEMEENKKIIEKLEKEYINLEQIFNKTGDNELECTDGTIIHVADDMEKLRFRIKVLNNELQKRTN